MQVYEVIDGQFMIFRLYTVYNKHKNWQSNQRKIASSIGSARIILLSTVHASRIVFGGTKGVTARIHR